MGRPLANRKCLHCQAFFTPHPRSAGRQRYCAKPACRKASKAASQRRWLNKPANRGYFKDPTHVDRVRQWRKAHPGYWRRRRSTPAGACGSRFQGSPQVVFRIRLRPLSEFQSPAKSGEIETVWRPRIDVHLCRHPRRDKARRVIYGKSGGHNNILALFKLPHVLRAYPACLSRNLCVG